MTFVYSSTVTWLDLPCLAYFLSYVRKTLFMLNSLEAQGGQHICLAAGTNNTQKTDSIKTYTLNRPRGPLSEKSNFLLANIIHKEYIFLLLQVVACKSGLRSKKE